jgi:hypothetical protein
MVFSPALLATCLVDGLVFLWLLLVALISARVVTFAHCDCCRADQATINFKKARLYHGVALKQMNGKKSSAHDHQ